MIIKIEGVGAIMIAVSLVMGSIQMGINIIKWIIK